MRLREGKHIAIIDNEGIEEKDIPADIINTSFLEIYLFPKEMDSRRFNHLRNIGSVIKKVEGKKNDSRNSKKGIRLSSIKREVSKSPDGKKFKPY